MSVAPSPVGSALAGSAIHEDWIAKYRTPEAQRFYETAFDEIARKLAAPPGAMILDAGCGSCAKSVLLAARGFHVVGVDSSESALSLAARTIRQHRVEGRVNVHRGDLLQLPFRTGEFRYAVCWGVLMHVPNLEGALAELGRVLAPGGLLVLSEGNVRSVQSRALRVVSRLLGRGRGRVVASPAGLESHEMTAQGALVTRQTDMRWLVAHCRGLGLRLKSRTAGQFTELYVVTPWGPVRRGLHLANDLWFRYVRRPGPAFANILIFEKTSRS